MFSQFVTKFITWPEIKKSRDRASKKAITNDVSFRAGCLITSSSGRGVRSGKKTSTPSLGERTRVKGRERGGRPGVLSRSSVGLFSPTFSFLCRIRFSLSYSRGIYVIVCLKTFDKRSSRKYGLIVGNTSAPSLSPTTSLIICSYNSPAFA